MKSESSTLRSMHADRMTIKTQEALQAALKLAPSRRHAQVSPEHLLAVLLEEQDGDTVASVLRKLGASPDALRADVNAALDALPTLTSEAEPTTWAEVMSVLRPAEREMRQLKDEYISVEHLLLALAAHDGPAGKALRGQG